MTKAVFVGTDIVSIQEFQEQIKVSKGHFLNKIFTPNELKTHSSLEGQAGAFAAKEAVMKALGLKVGSWTTIEIKKYDSGKPYVTFTDDNNNESVGDLSVSHTTQFAIATYVSISKK